MISFIKRIRYCCFFCLVLMAVTGSAQNNTNQYVFEKDQKITHSEVDAAYKRFTPTARDIRVADSLAWMYIKNNSDKYIWTKEITHYDSYYRQYVGYANLKAEKIIFINSFCQSDPDWKAQLINVKGGGSCYFNIKVDLDTRKAFNLHVNAPK